ncbi:response regulator [Sulfitobacter pacificus]|uniref:Response regulatory domain-containing protein n=1 Tax=Sulfitobacter pacificus TaxID=1499314 RepID=A0ABQ5VM38_9RHOB|nr:response regulator [Sulfitobacter pacificus]GLQ28099.1 hypothetical protein GCM10007927_29020 [Sulfitobacter pacificus]
MTPRRKILLVEDDPEIREVISIFLSSEPYEIVASENLSAALQRLSTMGPFDLAILDFWLGTEHSVSILDTIRAKGDNTPVIVISGGNDHMDLEATAAIADISGAVVFLQKPFQKSTLLEAVSSVLEI